MNPPPSPIFAGGANGSYVRGVTFCHDGRHIASVADDGCVKINVYFVFKCIDQFFFE